MTGEFSWAAIENAPSHTPILIAGPTASGKSALAWNGGPFGGTLSMQMHCRFLKTGAFCLRVPMQRMKPAQTCALWTPAYDARLFGWRVVAKSSRF